MEAIANSVNNINQLKNKLNKNLREKIDTLLSCNVISIEKDIFQYNVYKQTLIQNINYLNKKLNNHNEIVNNRKKDQANELIQKHFFYQNYEQYKKLSTLKNTKDKELGEKQAEKNKLFEEITKNQNKLKINIFKKLNELLKQGLYPKLEIDFNDNNKIIIKKDDKIICIDDLFTSLDTKYKENIAILIRDITKHRKKYSQFFLLSYSTSFIIRYKLCVPKLMNERQLTLEEENLSTTDKEVLLEQLKKEKALFLNIYFRNNTFEIKKSDKIFANISSEYITRFIRLYTAYNNSSHIDTSELRKFVAEGYAYLCPTLNNEPNTTDGSLFFCIPNEILLNCINHEDNDHVYE